jgi:uncharacterized protein (DUF433 family)
MATAARRVEYPHIVKTPGVRGGKARIDGTRICVVDVAIAYQQGHKPEEAQTYSSSRPLTLAEVMAALAYHYDHPEELEAYLGRGHDAEDEYEHSVRPRGVQAPAHPRAHSTSGRTSRRVTA